MTEAAGEGGGSCQPRGSGDKRKREEDEESGRQ